MSELMSLKDYHRENAKSESKYRNKKVTVSGHTFDSRREANRYAELRLLQKAGEISELKLQQRFELIPAQPSGLRPEKSMAYVADFTYKQAGHLVIEDAKGMRTQTYLIKRKLMKLINGIEIKEV